MTKPKPLSAEVLTLLEQVAKRRGWFRLEPVKGRIPSVITKAQAANLVTLSRRRNAYFNTIVDRDGAPVQYVNLTTDGHAALAAARHKPLESTR